MLQSCIAAVVLVGFSTSLAWSASLCKNHIENMTMTELKELWGTHSWKLVLAMDPEMTCFTACFSIDVEGKKATAFLTNGTTKIDYEGHELGNGRYKVSDNKDGHETTHTWGINANEKDGHVLVCQCLNGKVTVGFGYALDLDKIDEFQKRAEKHLKGVKLHVVWEEECKLTPCKK